MNNLQKWLFRALILALLCGLIGSTYAKYVKQDKLEGTVTIKASLGTIELLEHEAVDPEGDGEYTLDLTQEVTNNTYILLPGLDIPKDPFVRITNKSPIDAYVFIEVVDGVPANSGITYSLTTDWTELTGVAGAHGGKVYAYKNVVTNAFGNNGSGDIPILEDDTVYVSQKLDKSVKDLKLTFYASMYEAAAGADAATVWKHYNPAQNNP